MKSIASLRGKVLLVVAVTFLLFFLLISWISRAILLDGYIELENRYAETNLARAKSAYVRDLRGLNELAYDWAAWDDTFAFMVDRDPRYVASNLVESTFVGSRLSIFVLANELGEVAYGTRFDLQRESKLPLPAALLRLLRPGALFPHANEPAEKVISGLVRLPEGPLYLSSRPVLTSNDEGPVRGRLVMGRFLDASAVQRLSETIHMDLRAMPWAEYQTSRANGDAPIAANPTGFAQVVVLDEDTIAGFVPLLDIFGEPAVVLEGQMNRSIYAQGQRSSSYSFVTLFVLWLLFSTICLLALGRLVVHPIVRLSGQVARIGFGGNLAARLRPEGDDEVARLANSINAMLTRLEESEYSLRESEALHRQMFEENRAVKLLVETDTGMIVNANGAACAFYGCSREELKARTLAEIEEMPRLGLAETTGTSSSAPQHTVNRRHRTASGDVREVRVNVSPLRFRGRKLVFCIVHDVTELRRAEAQLSKKRDEIVQLSRLTTAGEMAAGITHELNQPLSAIVSYTTGCIARLQAGNVAVEQLTDAIRESRNEAQRAGEIIRRLRDFVQKGEVRKELVPLNEQITQSLRLIETDIQRTDTEIVLDFSSEVSEALADPIQLEQVILNLVRNALDAMEETPRGARMLTIATSLDESHIEVSVADTGPGLHNDASVDELFEPFYSTKVNGIGLGLAISRSIMTAHGGTLRARPGADRGLVFCLRLPTVRSGPAVSSDAALSGTRGRSSVQRTAKGKQHPT